MSNEAPRLLQSIRQSGKSDTMRRFVDAAPDEKRRKFRVAAMAKMKKFAKEYHSRKRDESLRRFVRRLTKPKNMRFQSLLRGVWAHARMEKAIVTAAKKQQKADANAT